MVLKNLIDASYKGVNFTVSAFSRAILLCFIKLISSLVIRPKQQRKCSNIQLFLIPVTCFGIDKKYISVITYMVLYWSDSH
jgi:hypothetical protein